MIGRTFLHFLRNHLFKPQAYLLRAYSYASALFLACAMVPSIAALSKAEEQKILREIQEAMRPGGPGDPKVILADCDPQKILKEIKEDEQKRELDRQEKHLNAIQWQNTLLTEGPTSIPGAEKTGLWWNKIGIFKKDLIDGALFACDIYADVKLYNELTRRRIEHIVIALTDDSDSFINVSKQVDASEIRFEDKLVGSPGELLPLVQSKEFGKGVLLNPLRRYLEEKHSLITSVNPFNRMTLAPLVMRWGWEKLSALIHDNYIVKMPTEDFEEWKAMYWKKSLSSDSKYPSKLKEAHGSAFVEGENGELTRIDGRIFTATTLARTIIKPLSVGRAVSGYFSLGRRQLELPPFPSHLGILEFVNKSQGKPIPGFFFSGIVRHALDFASIGLAAGLYEKVNQMKWEKFVLENRERVRKTVYNYRKVLNHAESDEKAIQDAKQEIRDLVIEGHASKSWVPGSPLFEWMASREGGKSTIKATLTGAIVFLGAMAAYKMYRAT